MTGQDLYKEAALSVRNARAVIITAGAGMGVDSGLPDFRGDRGFWKAYPMYERLGLSFYSAANPTHFRKDPAFGWGFYGHRANLYRDTQPHRGFGLLLEWINRYRLNYFVVTSNVDGHFQRAGFDPERILEVHGSIHHLQCAGPCGMDIWDNNEIIPVDTETMRALNLPQCPRCGGVARPNILMFGDFSWIGRRTAEQEDRFEYFTSKYRNSNTVIIEMGAGTGVPTIRRLSERLGRRPGTTVIRINPREPEIAKPHISLTCGALEGLRAMEELLLENN